METGLISPNLVTFAVTIVNIGLLCFLLRLILFKPVTKFMEARAKKIEDTINQAEKDKYLAKQALERYEAQLKDAQAQADEIIRLARESAAVEADRIIADGKRAAETLRANSLRQLAAEQEAAMAQFKAEAALLVMAASSRLLGRELQTDDNRRYATLLMDELSQQYRATRKGSV